MGKKEDKNYAENLQIAEKLIDRELDFEETRHEQIKKIASTYLGFISVLILLLINFNSGLVAGIDGKFLLSIPLIYFIYAGIAFLLFSAVLSIISHLPRKFQRPNISYEDKGLLVNNKMEKSKMEYKTYVLKNISNIVLNNANQTDSIAVWLTRAIMTFLSGIILISIGLVMGI